MSAVAKIRSTAAVLALVALPAVGLLGGLADHQATARSTITAAQDPMQPLTIDDTPWGPGGNG